MGLFRSLAVTVALLLAAGAGFVYSGIYDVAADAAHWPVTARIIDALKERSIAARMDGIRRRELRAASTMPGRCYSTP